MNLSLYILTLVPCAAVWVLLFRLIPAMELARFQRVITEVRDECEDHQFDGLLPVTDECVTQFVTRADLLNRYARGFTLVNALCAHWAARDARYELPEPPVSYAELEPEQRKIMHDLDMRLQAAVKRYLLAGSVTGWFLAASLGVARVVRTVRHMRHQAPTVRRLTVEFEEVASNWDHSGQRPISPRFAFTH